MDTIWYILAGLLSGVLSGMGMGGGTALIPILTILLSVSQHGAQSANLLAFLPGALLAIWVHRKNGRIDFKVARPYVLFGGMGAIIGSILASWIDADILRKGFGVFLTVLAFVQWRDRSDEKNVEK